ncbi:MAG: DUF5703 family protein [Kineosporiaceae bacterium]|jgi:hypothetical protein
MSEHTPVPVSPPPGDLPSVAGDYEYRVLTLPRGTSRADARRLLAEHAEYGHWELARVRLYMGGVRRVWLRRKIIRVVRTA